MSPSEAENSFKSITFGPRIMPARIDVRRLVLRAMVIMAGSRRRTLDDLRRDVAAGVAADVHDQPLLVGLRDNRA